MTITTTTAAIETAAVGKLFSRGGSLKSGSGDPEENFVGSGITSDSILHHIFQELSWFGFTLAEQHVEPLNYFGTRVLDVQAGHLRESSSPAAARSDLRRLTGGA